MRWHQRVIFAKSLMKQQVPMRKTGADSLQILFISKGWWEDIEQQKHPEAAWMEMVVNSLEKVSVAPSQGPNGASPFNSMTGPVIPLEVLGKGL